MIEHLLPLLPTEPDTRFLIASGAGVAIGAILWLVGARFSRYLVTLGGVAIGAYAGRAAPAVFGWEIDPMGPAFGLALVIGAIAFLAHRVVVAWLLGVVLSLVAMAAAWQWRGAPPVAFPPVEHAWTPERYAQELWAGVPQDVRDVAPHAGLICVLVGWGVALLWPRVGLVALYSILGLVLALFMGLCLVNMSQPSLLAYIPAQAAVQGAVLLGLITVGVLAQWIMLPKPKQTYQQPSLEADR